MQKYGLLAGFCALLLLQACGGGGSSSTPVLPPRPQLGLTLSSPSAEVFPLGGPSAIRIDVSRNGSTANLVLSVAGMPSGSSAEAQGLGTDSTGVLNLTAGTAAPGTYNLQVTCSDGTSSTSKQLVLVVGVSAALSQPASGIFDLAMSTSFQPAEWDYRLFQNIPSATTPLNDLGPQHIRLQAISQGVPQTSPTTWDFTKLDAIANPVLASTDHSPQFQIAVAPAFMYDTNHRLLDLTFQQFADYSAQLVRYYNTGGFTAPDGNHRSGASYPITYWGVFNEPNLNNLTASEYTALYNKVVPAMQAVDPNIKFVAVELSDFGSENTKTVPTFVNNVTAQVDVMATHFYSTCNQRDTDSQLFNTIPDFANRVTYLYSQMSTHPALAGVPVWITENNVNADFDKGGGVSACNGGSFTADRRGSSAFFSAWRPYLFSRLGKAGAKALYSWVFAGDAQYGEIDDQTGKPRLSYWVDYYLHHYLPSPSSIYNSTSTDDSEIEILATTRQADGSTVVMVANHAVSASTDNNGSGSPRSIDLDLTSLGVLNSAKVLTIDAATNVVNGPSETNLDLNGPHIVLRFSGYGVAFLSLK